MERAGVNAPPNYVLEKEMDDDEPDEHRPVKFETEVGVPARSRRRAAPRARPLLRSTVSALGDTSEANMRRLSLESSPEDEPRTGRPGVATRNGVDGTNGVPGESTVNSSAFPLRPLGCTIATTSSRSDVSYDHDEMVGVGG